MPFIQRMYYCIVTAALFASGATAAPAPPAATAPATQSAAASIDLRDYCTVLLALKLQDHLNVSDDQRAKMADLKTKLNAYMDNAAGNIHSGHVTPGIIAARAETVLAKVGTLVRDELTPDQRTTLANMFDDKTLQPIQIGAAVETGNSARGTTTISGVHLTYTHFGESAKPVRTSTSKTGDTAATAPVAATKPSSNATATQMPASPASPAPAATLPEGHGEWVALIPRIDLKRDTDAGAWSLTSGVLVNVKGRDQKTALLTVPVMPTGNYELEFTFNRVNGSQDLCVLFPAGGHGAQLWLGSFTGQTSFLEGPRQAKARDDLVRIVNEKPQHVHMTVETTEQQATIEVKLNGLQYLSWNGKIADLKVNPARATRDGRAIGLAVYKTTNVEFSELRVRALTGTIAPYVEGQ